MHRAKTSLVACDAQLFFWFLLLKSLATPTHIQLLLPANVLPCVQGNGGSFFVSKCPGTGQQKHKNIDNEILTKLNMKNILKQIVHIALFWGIFLASAWIAKEYSLRQASIKASQSINQKIENLISFSTQNVEGAF